MSQNMEVKSIVKFGQYPYDEKGNVQPISWRVLAKTGDAALIITEFGIDVKKYHPQCEAVTWEDCALRYWLNHNFFDAAFSEDEKSAILITGTPNDHTQEFKGFPTSGGNDTEDKVFCLSDCEAFRTYFHSDTERQCIPTPYAISKHALTNPEFGTIWWWLRSPGSSQFNVTFVGRDGSRYNYNADLPSICVRPALWVDLKLFKERKTVERKTEVKKYKVPCVWQMMGYLYVEADSPENAVKAAEKEGAVCSLPDNGRYLDESFAIDEEGEPIVVSEKEWLKAHEL